MAWTSPKTWVAAILTAAELNQQVRDNLIVLGAQRRVTSKLTADVTNNTVAYATTGLSVALDAGVAYHVLVKGSYQSAAVGTGIGFRLAASGGLTATALRVWSTIWGAATSASTPQKLQLTALGGANAHLTTATFAAATDYQFEIEGVIRVNAAGTLVLEFASEVAASQVTVKADAVLIATPVS